MRTKIKFSLSIMLCSKWWRSKRWSIDGNFWQDNDQEHMHSKDAPANFIFLDGVSESVDWLVGKKNWFLPLIFFQSQILTSILQIGLPTWSLAAKWSLGLGRSMSMRWFCLGMYGSAFGVNSTSNPVFFLRLILEFKIFYMATDKYSNIKQNGGMKKFGYCWLCEKFEALRFSLRLGKNRRNKETKERQY